MLVLILLVIFAILAILGGMLLSEANSTDSQEIGAIMLIVGFVGWFCVSLTCTVYTEDTVLHKNTDYVAVSLPLNDTTDVPDKLVIYECHTNAQLFSTTIASEIKAFTGSDSITVCKPMTLYKYGSLGQPEYIPHP